MNDDKPWKPSSSSSSSSTSTAAVTSTSESVSSTGAGVIPNIDRETSDSKSFAGFDGGGLDGVGVGGGGSGGKVEEEEEGGEKKTKKEVGEDEPREQHNVLEVAAELTRLSEAFGQGT